MALTPLVTPNRKSPIAANYSSWWRSLTADERKKLIASGAFRADDPADATPLESRSLMNGNHFDFQRNEQESFNRVQQKVGSFSLGLDQSNPTVQEVQANEDSQAPQDPRLNHLDLASTRLRATLQFLLEGLDESTDPAMRLHAQIIRLVVGEGKPPNMTTLARTHGISKAAVSLRCRKLLRQLGIEPSRFMRPEDEVNNMRISSILRGFRDPPTPPTPHKESLCTPPGGLTRQRPREKEAKKPRFSMGKRKAGQD
jgi:hypothetical protein